MVLEVGIPDGRCRGDPPPSNSPAETPPDSCQPQPSPPAEHARLASWPFARPGHRFYTSKARSRRRKPSRELDFFSKIEGIIPSSSPAQKGRHDTFRRKLANNSTTAVQRRSRIRSWERRVRMRKIGQKVRGRREKNNNRKQDGESSMRTSIIKASLSCPHTLRKPICPARPRKAVPGDQGERQCLCFCDQVSNAFPSSIPSNRPVPKPSHTSPSRHSNSCVS